MVEAQMRMLEVPRSPVRGRQHRWGEENERWRNDFKKIVEGPLPSHHVVNGWE